MGRRLWGGWSKELWAKFGVVGGAVFVLIPLLAFLLGFNMGNAILWASGLVLLVYTLETQAMRLELVRQNEIAVQPLLITAIEPRQIGWAPASTFGPQVVLRNIGRGPALFIQVKEIELLDEGGVRFVARFETVDCLEPEKDTVAKVNLWTEAPEEVRKRFELVSNLNPRYARQKYEVTISYEDINGQKRESVMQMGKGGIRLLRHRKV